MKLNNIYFFLLAAVLVTIGCREKEDVAGLAAGEAIQADSLPGACPYLTKDSQGRIVMSWVRSTTDSTFVFCYAVSGDKGKSFGEPVVIPASTNIRPHSENLPKIIFKLNGDIMALWGASNPNPKNKYSGLVYYSSSVDGGLTWTPSRPLVTDTASFDQRYYDVAQLPSGEVAIIWLDNRKTTEKEGSALYFATSNNNNEFVNEKMISQECCQCCRTDLFVDSKSGIHVLYRGIIQDSIRDMLHSVSTDGGKQFSAPKLISNDQWVIRGCPHTGPSMTENENGLHFAWYTGGRTKGCFYTRSGDNGKSFDQHEQVSAAGSHPQIASFENGDLLVAWDESIPGHNPPRKRVAVQHRSKDGEVESQAFITPDSSFASYPVIAPLSDQSSLVAYSQKRGQQDYIMYQVVNKK